MARRPRSPGGSPAPWEEDQPAGPQVDKRPRIEEPAEAHIPLAPRLQEPQEPRAAMLHVSVVVLAPGCGLQVPLGHGHVLVEPEPSAVTQVSLPGQLLLVLSDAHLRSVDQSRGGRGPWPRGLPPGAALGARGRVLPLEHRLRSATWPRVPVQEEHWQLPAGPRTLNFCMVSARGFLPAARSQRSAQTPRLQGPQGSLPWLGAASRDSHLPSSSSSSSPPHLALKYSLQAHLQHLAPSSALRPLPPSPSPGPLSWQTPPRPWRPGPRPKARRCLFH